MLLFASDMLPPPHPHPTHPTLSPHAVLHVGGCPAVLYQRLTLPPHAHRTTGTGGTARWVGGHGWPVLHRWVDGWVVTLCIYVWEGWPVGRAGHGCCICCDVHGHVCVLCGGTTTSHCRTHIAFPRAVWQHPDPGPDLQVPAEEV